MAIVILLTVKESHWQYCHVIYNADTWITWSNKSLSGTNPLDIRHTAVRRHSALTITQRSVLRKTAEVQKFTGPQTICQTWCSQYQRTICISQKHCTSKQRQILAQLSCL